VPLIALPQSALGSFHVAHVDFGVLQIDVFAAQLFDFRGTQPEEAAENQVPENDRRFGSGFQERPHLVWGFRSAVPETKAVAPINAYR